MAHGTKINGTSYGVTGGKCLVGGTEYSVQKGRTLVGGTGYNIQFKPFTTVELIEIGTYVKVEINGKLYTGSTKLEFGANDAVTLHVYDTRGISLNGDDPTKRTELTLDVTGMYCTVENPARYVVRVYAREA